MRITKKITRDELLKFGFDIGEGDYDLEYHIETSLIISWHPNSNFHLENSSEYQSFELPLNIESIKELKQFIKLIKRS
jgi:hypothetical protein